jgi:signal transduction histidine kinase
VLPLVEEVNAMIEAQDREIERSRGRAADLVHGLKTPLAALVADAGRLRQRGECAIANDIEAVGKAMSRHVDRELARVRLRREVRRGAQVTTELGSLVQSLVAILLRTPAGTGIDFENDIAEAVMLPFDRTDLTGVLGNLLDDAVRHAKSCVRIGTRDAGTGLSVIVEDDGRGVDLDKMATVLERRVRLDQRGEGAGLGLSIVQEVIDAYGWKLRLGVSDLGGLRAECCPAG